MIAGDPCRYCGVLGCVGHPLMTSTKEYDLGYAHIEKQDAELKAAHEEIERLKKLVHGYQEDLRRWQIEDQTPRLTQALDEARYELGNYADVLRHEGGRYAEIEELVAKIAAILGKSE